MKLYAISDIHGCFNEFKKILEELKGVKNDDE